MKIALIAFRGAQWIARVDALLDEGELSVTEQRLWVLTPSDSVVSPFVAEETAENTTLIPTGAVPVSEVSLASLQTLYRQYQPDLLLFGGDPFSQLLATQLASRLGGMSILNVEHIKPTCVSGALFEVVKRAFSQVLTAEIVVSRLPCCLSLSRQAASSREEEGGWKERKVFSSVYREAPWLKTCQSEWQPSLANGAEKALVIGRGVPLGLIPELSSFCQQQGFFLFGTRPVIMNGGLGLDRLVGVSGLRLAPKICLVLGASGAAAFLQGIEESQWVIAINRDHRAPIFQRANVAIVADVQEVLRQWLTDWQSDIQRAGG